MPKNFFTATVFLVLLIGLLIWAGVFLFSADKTESDTSVEDNSQSQAFILPASEPNLFPLRNSYASDPTVQARAAVLYDSVSEKFLYQKNSTQKLPIASLTKLMTAVVIVENLDLNGIVTVNIEDLNVDGYGADLSKGEKIKVSELFKVMLIKSSNDAALALSRYGRENGIDVVAKMNEKARELGMHDTQFIDPAGLSDSAFSTAEDLVKLVKYVGKYPLIWQILRMSTASAVSVDSQFQHHLINADQLLGKVSGIIGGKTGFTDKAMGTMVLVIDVDGTNNIIGVILGSQDRFTEIKNLIEWGIVSYRWR